MEKQFDLTEISSNLYGPTATGMMGGSKMNYNMFGGAIYTKPTLEIYPDFIQEAPLERGLTRHTYALLGKKDVISIIDDSIAINI